MVKEKFDKLTPEQQSRVLELEKREGLEMADWFIEVEAIPKSQFISGCGNLSGDDFLKAP